MGYYCVLIQVRERDLMNLDEDAVPGLFLRAAPPGGRDTALTELIVYEEPPMPNWKRRRTELLEWMPLAFNTCHGQPIRSSKKIASMAQRSSTRGLWHPSGWPGRGGSNLAKRIQSGSGIRHPLSRTAVAVLAETLAT